MALKIKIKKQKGNAEIDVQHWEIEELYVKPAEKYLTCELRGYESKAKRDEHASIGATTDEYRFRFSLSGTDFPDITKKNFMLDVFAFIKRQNNKHGIDWTKAVDA